MKALILIIALLLISSTFGYSLRMKNHQRGGPQGRRGGDPFRNAGLVTKAIETIRDADQLINDPKAARQFWKDFFAKYDIDGSEGLSPEEFYGGIDEWTSSNGFGASFPMGPNALFKQLDKDGSGVLSLDEAVEGSQELFSWYEDMAKNRLYNAASDLAADVDSTRCDDLKKSFESLWYPGVEEETIAQIDVNGSGTISKEEIEPLITQSIFIYSVDRLSQDEENNLWNNYADANGEISTDDLFKFYADYTQKVAKKAGC